MLALTIFYAFASVYGAEIAWEQLPGQLKQLNAGPGFLHVCGSNWNDDVFCSRTDRIEWYSGSAKMKQVAVGKGQVFGVNRNNDVFYSRSADRDQVVFSQIPGKLQQVSFDGTTVCGVGLQNELYCADQDVATSPKWFGIPGSLKEILVNGNQLYGVNSKDEIFYSPSVKNAAWVQIPGVLRQVQFDGTTLCGTNAASNIFCADTGLTTNPNWYQVPGQLTHVSIAAGQLVGTNALSNIYKGKLSSMGAETTYPVAGDNGEPAYDASTPIAIPSNFVFKQTGGQVIGNGFSAGASFSANYLTETTASTRDVPVSIALQPGAYDIIIDTFDGSGKFTAHTAGPVLGHVYKKGTEAGRYTVAQGSAMFGGYVIDGTYKITQCTGINKA